MLAKLIVTCPKCNAHGSPCKVITVKNIWALKVACSECGSKLTRANERAAWELVSEKTATR